MSSPLYQKFTINPEKGEIRFLEIVGVPDDEIIECVFHIVSLSAGPKYTALSYSWESPSEGSPLEEITPARNTIRINGYMVQIRDNLYHFLLEARKQKRRYRWIWVDAVCIDQDNTTEKNHEVPRMAQIYSEASSVVAWLGNATSDTNKAFEYANSRHFYRKHLFLKYGPWGDIEREQVGRCEKFLLQYDKEVLKLGQLIAALFSRRYWTRYWIIQEILLSNNLSIVCGDREISWDQCFSAILMFSRVEKSQQSALENLEVLGKKFTNFFLRSKGYFLSNRRSQPLELLEALLLFFHKGCSNKKDRIFALQGIILEHERIEVDYKQSCEEVYMNAAYVIARSAVRYTTERVFAAAGDQGKILSIISDDVSRLEQIRKLFVEFSNTNARPDVNSFDDCIFTRWKIRMGILMWQIDKAASKVRQTGLYHDPLEERPGPEEQVFWLEMTENSGILEWGTEDKPCRLGPGLAWSGPEEGFGSAMNILGRAAELIGSPDPGNITTVMNPTPRPWYHEIEES